MKSFESFSHTEPIQENLENKKEKLNEDIVRRIQNAYLSAAEKYLPKESPLRNQIILFYSDFDRLYAELSNVFEGTEKDVVEKKVEEIETLTGDGTAFTEYVHTKNYATAKETSIPSIENTEELIIKSRLVSGEFLSKENLLESTFDMTKVQKDTLYSILIIDGKIVGLAEIQQKEEGPEKLVIKSLEIDPTYVEYESELQEQAKEFIRENNQILRKEG